MNATSFSIEETFVSQTESERAHNLRTAMQRCKPAAYFGDEAGDPPNFPLAFRDPASTD